MVKDGGEVDGEILFFLEPMLKTVGKTLAIMVGGAVLAVIAGEGDGGEANLAGKKLPEGGFEAVGGKEAVVDVEKENGWLPKGLGGYLVGSLKGDSGGPEALSLGVSAAEFVAVGQGAVLADDPEAGDLGIGVLVEEPARRPRRKVEKPAELGIRDDLAGRNLL